jgi:phosphoribosylamine--glycine ligase
MEEAERALQAIMIDHVHGDSGKEVIVEEYLDGVEISIHALSDGFSYLLFPSSQDHKRALDGDLGPNTGGMGTIAPTPWATLDMMHAIETRVVGTTLEALRQHADEFDGLLYPGIMITNDGPKVLEFNARFGDPETQVYMRLLKSDLLDLLEACSDHTLSTVKDFVQWERAFAVTIVLASGGYPGEYETGYAITGIEEAEKIPGVVVFHAATKFEGELRTAGGRVLGVSATGLSLKLALETAYKAVGMIHFEGMQYRRDIGAKPLEYYTSIRV